MRSCFLLVFMMSLGAVAAEYQRGVNLAGAEFSSGNVPGKIGQSHTYQSEASFRYFGQKGLKLVRFPILWERWQPALDGELDPTELNAFKQDIVWARNSGCSLIIDLHNYARRRVKESDGAKDYVIDREYAGEVKIPVGAFADFWRRVSIEFKNEPVVWAYGLMNEPHDLGGADWKAISQAAVNAIRGNADSKMILAAGDGWSSAAGWPKNNGEKSWIIDPAANFMYEAHCYFDKNNSGAYKQTYEEEVAADSKLPNRGPDRLAVFAKWCKTNNVHGFLGEFGVPNTDPRWSTIVLENFLKSLDAAEMGGTYWAAGELWGRYPLSVQPADNFKKDAAQLEILQKHESSPKEGK